MNMVAEQNFMFMNGQYKTAVYIIDFLLVFF